MIANGLFDGHSLLSDWAFLIAAVAFAVVAVVVAARTADRPADGRLAGSGGLWRALPYVGSALVAFGLLVL